MVDSLSEMITERGGQKFSKHIDMHSVTNAINEIEASMIFLVFTFFCGLVVNELKGVEHFPGPMNRNCLDLILGRCNRDCCTM